MPNRDQVHNDIAEASAPVQVKMNREYTLEDLLQLCVDDFENLDPQKLENTPPHTLALFLQRHRVDERRIILRLLSEAQTCAVLAEMDSHDTAETVGAMREWRAVKILEELDPDDAADVVSELEENDRNRLLNKLLPETAETVRKLLTYNEDTAGGIMNPHVASVPLSVTVDEAIQYLRQLKGKVKHIHYIYALDEQGRLEGVLSIRELLLASPHQKIYEIARTALRGICKTSDDKEAVALMLADLNLSALPVVDAQGHLLGMITYDDVIDILQEEATEDIQKLVGAGPNESIHHGIGFSVSRRSPWLLVNLLTAFMAAGVVYIFRFQIERYTLLAVFTPIVASLGGNTGSQTLAVAIRSLALGELQPTDSWHVCLRECFKGFLNGVPLGLIAAGAAWIVSQNMRLAAVMFCACILNMALAGITGAFIPLFLKRLHFDPAQSSSIFLTAITDMGGFFLFLSLGSWLLL